jgi:hypothetical protein
MISYVGHTTLKPEGRRPLWRPVCLEEDNNGMDLKGREDVDNFGSQ